MDAINALMQQLLRDDEVPPPPPLPAQQPQGGAGAAALPEPALRPSSLGGSLVEEGGRARGAGRVDETGVESAARRLDELALAEARGKAAAAEQESINSATRKALRYATVPLAEAKERARRIATGEVHGGGEQEGGS